MQGFCRGCAGRSPSHPSRTEVLSCRQFSGDQALTTGSLFRSTLFTFVLGLCAFFAVLFPMEWLQISQLVTSTFIFWVFVINLPAVFSLCAIRSETDFIAVSILSPNIGIFTLHFFRFVPNFLN